MKKALTTICCLLALGLPATSSALDANAAVRVVPLLTTATTWIGAAIAYPPGQAEVTALLVEIAPNGETGWHRHGVPSFAYVLEGTLEITTRAGQTKRLQAGEALSEVVDVAHNGRNMGNEPVKLVVFYAGAAGVVNTHREP